MDTTLPLHDQSPVLGSQILGSRLFDPAYWFNHEVSLSREFYIYITSDGFHTTLITIAALLSIFFITIICYCFIRMLEIRKKEHDHIHHEVAEYTHKQKQREEKAKAGESTVSKNAKWNQVLTLLFSQSPSDWKLSVIEADAILEDLLDSMGYRGETLGDKLKTGGLSGFKLLNSAWDAHNVRNKIAHEGSAFELSQREAKRVIALYEQVFREYGFI